MADGEGGNRYSRLLDPAASRLERYPSRCYEIVEAPNYSKEMSRLYEYAAKREISLRVANGNLIVGRKDAQSDAAAWPQLIHVLLCGSKRTSSIEVEIRETNVTVWDSLMVAHSSWVECSKPHMRTLAPGCDVVVFTVSPKRHAIRGHPDCVTSARPSDISPELMRTVLAALAIIDDATAASASIPHPIMTDSASNRGLVELDVSNALAFARVERGIVGQIDTHGRTIVFRPSLQHVMNKIVQLLTSSTQTGAPQKELHVPIFAFVGQENGIDPFRRYTIEVSHPSLVHDCCFIGLQPVASTDGCSYDAAVFVPARLAAEVLSGPRPAVVGGHDSANIHNQSQLSQITSNYPNVLYMNREPARSEPPITPKSSNHVNHKFVSGDHHIALSREGVVQLQLTVQKLETDVGCTFADTSIPANDDTLAAVQRQLIQSSKDHRCEARIGHTTIELAICDAELAHRLTRLSAELQTFAKGRGAPRTIVTITAEKKHNDLRSRLIQQGKALDLMLEKETFMLPGGREGHRLIIGPSDKKKGNPPPLPKSSPPLHQPPPQPRQEIPPAEIIKYPPRFLEGHSMAMAQPSRADERRGGRNMAANALYSLIAPNQETLPAGWEYRVAASSPEEGGAGSSSMVFLNHLTRKAYSRVRTREDVHMAILNDGGELAFAAALANGQPVLPF